MGRPYDYSAGRMRELRREASRYREAHNGRARDSWLTLCRAVRSRRLQDLELLALPPVELSVRLPPARPTRTAISAEVANDETLGESSPVTTGKHFVVIIFLFIYAVCAIIWYTNYIHIYNT